MDIFMNQSLRNVVREFFDSLYSLSTYIEECVFGLAILRIDVGHFPTEHAPRGGC